MARQVVPPSIPIARGSVGGRSGLCARTGFGREGRKDQVDHISGQEVDLAAKEWEFTPAVQND
ncbi:MAG TPA: hypothetical protein EYG11_09020 [Candidatus Latescibacteria bacterium]|nr:hypothetical protein [Candidatus Handelsmanbacteria bacterium]HIL08828.1 hypothetical protein [Candidatus Latescibacterota bacterium]